METFAVVQEIVDKKSPGIPDRYQAGMPGQIILVKLPYSVRLRI